MSLDPRVDQLAENLAPRNLPRDQLSLDELQAINLYVREEVDRQGRSYYPYAGYMFTAWMDAIDHQYHGDALSVGMVERWGSMIEPERNKCGFRTIPIYVGGRVNGVYTTEQKVRPEKIADRMNLLMEVIDDMTAFEAYREFENIHPFADGNGRTGKIILNWLNGTLLDPIFPSNDFWGHWIVNP